uniref:Uncharacterized protein n=1 Tax=viral metagenome TaxID=1070528 RepID=A0A6M3KMT6_9ZZZZ
MIKLDIMDMYLRRKKIGDLPIRKKEPIHSTPFNTDPMWNAANELTKNGKFKEANDLVQLIYKKHKY